MKVKHLAISEDGFIFDPTTGNSFTTNETGLFILRMLREGKTPEEIVKALSAEYDVDEGEAERDVLDFMEKLRRYKLL